MLFIFFSSGRPNNNMLFTFQVKSLDGFWDFAVPPIDDLQKGHREGWFSDSLTKVIFNFFSNYKFEVKILASM
jgi:TolB-like protein